MEYSPKQEKELMIRWVIDAFRRTVGSKMMMVGVHFAAYRFTKALFLLKSIWRGMKLFSTEKQTLESG